MRRLAVLAAAVFGPAVYAADPDAATPTGAQTVPTLPQVPRPLLNGETIVPGEAGRAEVPPPAQPVRSRLRPTVRVEAGEGQPATSRWSLPSTFTRTAKTDVVEPYDPTAPTPVPSRLPTRGANGGTGATAITAPPAKALPAPAPVPVAPASPVMQPAPTPAGPGCAGGECATTAHGGTWSCFKNWPCFRQTRVWIGLHPTPYVPPFHTQFLCQEKGLCGPAGCTGPGCVAPSGGPAPGVVTNGTPNGAANGGTNPAPGSGGPARSAAPARPGLGSRVFGRRTEKEKVQPGWATAGETVPGYRLAIPETPAIVGKGGPAAIPPVPPVLPPVPPVIGTSFPVVPEPDQR